MQTFLPYEDFNKCAECLDDKRLYKQVVECKQILNVLRLKRERKKFWEDSNKLERVSLDKFNSLVKKIAWENHPAVLMWEGWEHALRGYQMCMLDEWLKRRWGAELSEYLLNIHTHCYLPRWLGDERLHVSHKANLFYKDPEHYKQFKGEYYENLADYELEDGDKPEYYWPVKKEE